MTTKTRTVGAAYVVELCRRNRDDGTSIQKELIYAGICKGTVS